MVTKTSFLKSYSFSLFLIASIGIGSILGIVLKDKAVVLKPLGDIFLNLLFTIVGPLVFFSVSSVIAGMSDLRRLGKIIGCMLVIFVVTGILASALMIIGVKIYPPAQGVQIAFDRPVSSEPINIGQQLVQALTVSEFSELLSKKNMLALILFSFLVGLATSAAGAKGKPFAQFLLAGNEVMSKAIGYVMLLAPVGLGAYFAYLVGTFGPQLLGSYFRVIVLY